MNEDDFTVLINYRIEQAQTTLSDAKYLIDGKRSAQSIVNRSYYAMFYSVLALLQKISKVPSKHSGAISLFDTEFVKKEIFPKELSKNLHKALKLRQTFDYKIIESIPFNHAEDIWQNAKQFVETVKTYLIPEEE